jgi:hypothetical protein
LYSLFSGPCHNHVEQVVEGLDSRKLDHSNNRYQCVR